MKPFICKLACVSLLALLPSVPIVWWKVKTESYKTGVGFEVYAAMARSKTVSPGVRAVILGDSVAYQFFNHLPLGPEVVSLACNQAVSLAGYIFFLEDFLDRNPAVQEIYLITHPLCLSNDLDQKWTFNYFLKPFDTPEYRHRFPREVRTALQRHPYRWLVRIPFVRFSQWSPDYEPESPRSISPISLKGWARLQALARQQGAELFIISPPISEEKRSDVESMEFRGFSSDYASRFTYLPADVFSDGIHPKDPDRVRKEWETNLPGVWLVTALKQAGRKSD